MMANFNLGDKYDKYEIISMHMTRAWDTVKWPRSQLSISSLSSVDTAPARYSVARGHGFDPVGDSDFFFFPLSCHVDYFIFIVFLTELKISHLFFFHLSFT